MVVQTTAGPIPATELGFTSMHEHVMLFMGRGVATLRYEKPELFSEAVRSGSADLDMLWGQGREDALELATRELRAARDAGMRSILDCSPPEMGRDLRFVAEAARRAGIHLVISTGLMGKFPKPSAYFESVGLDTTVDLFVRDIEVGIADTGIRAGAFKTSIGMGYHHEPPAGFEFPEGIQADASLTEGPSASTEFALQAAARTQYLTNVLINVHTASTYRTGAMACDRLEKAGADLTRVGIHHAGETNDVDYLHGLLDRGVSLCMDPHRYAWNLPMIARLVSESYAEQIVLAVDSVLVEEAPLPAFWFSDQAEWAERSKEWMPSYVPLAVIPGLMEHGVSDQAIRLMTIENPARLLER